MSHEDFATEDIKAAALEMNTINRKAPGADYIQSFLIK